jgi:electron transfer flavoprotein alpha subunit
MTGEILLLAEQDGGELDPASADLICWGESLASAQGWRVTSLLLGHGVEAAVQALADLGVGQILVCDDPRLADYDPSLYRQMIEEVLSDGSPRVIMTAHSYIGIEMAAVMATRCGATEVSNCHSIELAEQGFLVRRAMFGGKFLAAVEFSGEEPLVVTISREAKAPKISSNCKTEVVNLTCPAHYSGPVKVLATSRPERVEDISKADIVVAVGRGIRDPTQIDLFRQLAQELGGALAASRPLVDAGWLSNDHQVGLSGVTVRPKVYLAFGISGSAQHLVGMNQAKQIIAVNSDPDAPIFAAAHYGAVADMFEVVPHLLAKTKLA